MHTEKRVEERCLRRFSHLKVDLCCLEQSDRLSINNQRNFLISSCISWTDVTQDYLGMDKRWRDKERICRFDSKETPPFFSLETDKEKVRGAIQSSKLRDACHVFFSSLPQDLICSLALILVIFLFSFYLFFVTFFLSSRRCSSRKVHTRDLEEKRKNNQSRKRQTDRDKEHNNETWITWYTTRRFLCLKKIWSCLYAFCVKIQSISSFFSQCLFCLLLTVYPSLDCRTFSSS